MRFMNRFCTFGHDIKARMNFNSTAGKTKIISVISDMIIYKECLSMPSFLSPCLIKDLPETRALLSKTECGSSVLSSTIEKDVCTLAGLVTLNTMQD